METIYLLEIENELPIAYEVLDEAHLIAYKKNKPFTIKTIAFNNSEEIPQHIFPEQDGNLINIVSVNGNKICELEIEYIYEAMSCSNDPEDDEMTNIAYIDSIILKIEEPKNKTGFDYKSLSEMSLSTDLLIDINTLAQAICNDKNGL